MNIIYKDQHIIVVNKPAGLVVFSEDETEKSVAKDLAIAFPELNEVHKKRKGAVHRLDKDTSGVLLFARDKKTFHLLQKEFLEQNVKKSYIALVFKSMNKKSEKIETFITRSPKDRRKQKAYNAKEGKRKAITSFRVIERFKDFSLLEVFPKTGRKHQIRCHLAHIGHPVAGDKLYRFKDQVDPQKLKRQFLHAKSLSIKTPKGEKGFLAELPPDLKNVIRNLKKNVY